MKTVVTLFCLCTCFIAIGQTIISGKVKDTKGTPIEGANVYLEGTYDGASTDVNGDFSFETTETGTHQLIVSMVSFESYSQTGDISYFKDMEVTLHEALNQLNGVTLTAGSFKAGDNSKASVLKPLDIVTTAGAAGDFVAALPNVARNIYGKRRRKIVRKGRCCWGDPSIYRWFKGFSTL